MVRFYRIEDSLKDAILTIIRYIHAQTGVEPTQEEVAELLTSYFILNEVSNQIKYQLKKKDAKPGIEPIVALKPFWRLNLKDGPGQNILARAGIFLRCVKEAIDATREHMQTTIGVDPPFDIIAKSLKSSFILSEIKNQADFLRNQTRQKKA